ncbi:MAG: two-component system response regulator OmpR [Gammaproteobacteria bacterium HGW-Gammaproteobacteria-1]|jgi:DNA-binding response OmpR family regulator|nr:MAG: two-component system response regulator OmpR [Gammaproteobacteria bacterium HGW-Gammaproteobacteria-1]
MINGKEHVLVVDDDAALRGLLTRYLSENGYAVTAVADGVEMAAAMAQQKPDLVILDLMLPGEDGFALARHLRSDGDIPIVMLSARGEDIDRIVGLEIGADDYLPKPFNPRELLARIRAVLRRQRPPAAPAPHAAFCFGPYRLEAERHRLLRGGEEVALTTGEFALLRVFAEHPNRVLERDVLLERLKGYERNPFDRSIDVRVNRLRRKIETDPANPRYIRTVWGEGYMFCPEAE